MRNWLITTEPEKLEYYKGLLIRAHSGLHEQALSLLLKYVREGSEILDAGAGAGAFSQRMLDAKYIVTATDVNPDEWTLKEIPFIQLDIDLGISKSLNRSFDVVCCLEVIEHLENPWNLLREINQLVKPGGFIFISTPNISSFLSRLFFLRKGEFFQFSEDALKYGHINPISDFEISLIARKVGWKIVEKMPAGYLPIFDFSEKNLESVVKNIFRVIAYWVSKGNKEGWVTLYVLKKETDTI